MTDEDRAIALLDALSAAEERYELVYDPDEAVARMRAAKLAAIATFATETRRAAVRDVADGVNVGYPLVAELILESLEHGAFDE
jgi:hypothetical protein